MSDGFLTRTLPFFNGVLAFLPACGGTTSSDTGADTGSGETSGSPTSSPETTVDPTTETSGNTTEDPTTETSLDSTETGTPGGCPEGSLCGSEPPDGWFGPTIIARVQDGAEPPPCPEDFPDLGPDLLADFVTAPPAVCNCECEPPASPSCDGNVIVRGQNSCSGFVNSASPQATCTNFSIDGFTEFNLYGYYYYYNPGECTAEQTSEIPPIAWEAQITTCGLTDAPMACEFNGICIPPPPSGFESTWCIWQQGDVGCPAGVFNTKSLFFTGAEDTRDCSDCSCASPSSTCEGAELMLFSSLDCAGDPSAVLDANGSCLDVTAQSFAVDFPLADSCPVTTAPHPMGTAEPTGEFTFCCTG